MLSSAYERWVWPGWRVRRMSYLAPEPSSPTLVKHSQRLDEHRRRRRDRHRFPRTADLSRSDPRSCVAPVGQARSRLMYSVGMDMGGTFTDGYFTDGSRATTCKVPTTHFDLTQSVMACLHTGSDSFGTISTSFSRRWTSFDWPPRLARTRSSREPATPLGSWSTSVRPRLSMERVEPLPRLGVFVRPDQVVGISDSDDVEDVLGHCRDLVLSGVRQVVVSFSTERQPTSDSCASSSASRYPAHYLRSIPLTLGSEVANVADNELRTTTTILNAYVSRPMAKLMYRTEGLLQQAGSDCSVARSAFRCLLWARGPNNGHQHVQLGSRGRALLGGGAGSGQRRSPRPRVRHGWHNPRPGARPRRRVLVNPHRRFVESEYRSRCPVWSRSDWAGHRLPRFADDGSISGRPGERGRSPGTSQLRSRWSRANAHRRRSGARSAQCGTQLSDEIELDADAAAGASAPGRRRRSRCALSDPAALPMKRPPPRSARS